MLPIRILATSHYVFSVYPLMIVAFRQALAAEYRLFFGNAPFEVVPGDEAMSRFFVFQRNLFSTLVEATPFVGLAVATSFFAILLVAVPVAVQSPNFREKRFFLPLVVPMACWANPLVWWFFW